jgi:hypothetical protein
MTGRSNGADEIIARAQRVHANGYLPVPVLRHDAPAEIVINGQRRKQSPGKQPHGRIWSYKEDYVYRATPASIARWRQFPGIADHTNLGIACGVIACVDIDVYDVDLAERVEALARQLLGSTALVRVGQWPKRALVYRIAGGPLAKVQTPEFLKGEFKAKVEVLGQGQQFVAFGIHPATRAPYEWAGVTPETLPAAELPTVPRPRCGRSSPRPRPCSAPTAIAPGRSSKPRRNGAQGSGWPATTCSAGSTRRRCRTWAPGCRRCSGAAPTRTGTTCGGCRPRRSAGAARRI